MSELTLAEEAAALAIDEEDATELEAILERLEHDCRQHLFDFELYSFALENRLVIRPQAKDHQLNVEVFASSPDLAERNPDRWNPALFSLSRHLNSCGHGYQTSPLGSSPFGLKVRVGKFSLELNTLGQGNFYQLFRLPLNKSKPELELATYWRTPDMPIAKHPQSPGEVTRRQNLYLTALLWQRDWALHQACFHGRYQQAITLPFAYALSWYATNFPDSSLDDLASNPWTFLQLKDQPTELYQRLQQTFPFMASFLGGKENWDAFLGSFFLYLLGSK